MKNKMACCISHMAKRWLTEVNLLLITYNELVQTKRYGWNVMVYLMIMFCHATPVRKTASVFIFVRKLA